jgi:FtsP/CotA-like multicopper oxidase with cupredoxin domain
LPVNFTGRPRRATVVNGSLPAPLLRFREGDTVTVRVRNRLDFDTSIHWHGLILPANMDGVPGLSFHGIRAGDSSSCCRTARTGITRTRLSRNRPASMVR